jgi:hypothetical protein
MDSIYSRTKIYKNEVDDTNTCSIFLANVINKIHLLVASYIIFGFLLPDIDIGLFGIPLFVIVWPLVYLQWCLLNGKCCLTVLENYLRGKSNKSFIQDTLVKIGICLTITDVDMCNNTISTISWLFGVYQVCTGIRNGL